jgi:alanine racemase
MKTFYRKTWVEISLDALYHNLSQIKQMLPEDLKIMAVVKANAYGHGAVQISKYALACGVEYLSVAFLDEALELRQAGINAPILVLGYTPPDSLRIAWEYGITITAFSEEVMQAAIELTQSEQYQQARNPQGHFKKLKVHIKMDTGMGRIGLHTPSLAIAYIDRMLNCEGIEVEGLFTHYAKADDVDKSYTFTQYQRFESIVQYFANRGIQFPLLHAGNSATAIDLPQLTYNMVRIGISMYGLYPSAEVNHEQVHLRPVLSLKTKVVQVKTLPRSSGISYGTRYFTQSDELIATLPIGYADGYSRMLTGKAHVLIQGNKAPVVGTICMDQCMIRVDSSLQVFPGEEVVLIGQSAEEIISAEMVAGWLGTINYEVTCMISHRVPRVYILQGQRIEVNNTLI